MREGGRTPVLAADAMQAEERDNADAQGGDG